MWRVGTPLGRGQSNVVAVAILLGIVLTVSIAIVSGGAALLQQGEAETSTQSAEMTMTQVRSAVSDLQAAGAGSRRISFEGIGEDGDVAVTDGGTMRVVVTEPSGPGTVLNRSVRLGTLAYRRGDAVVAYQGGGIWRRNVGGTGSSVVRPPPFDYRVGDGNATLTLPIVRVRGAAAGTAVDIRSGGPARSLVPATGATNPLRAGQAVTVVVTSDFYRAWGRVLGARTDAAITYDHANRTARIELGAVQGSNTTATVTAGGTAPAALVTTRVTQMHVDNRARTASYDSSDPPITFSGTRGDVYIRGGYSPSSEDIEISGDVVATDTSRLDNADGATPQSVTGNVTLGGTPGDATPTKVLGYHDVGGFLSTQDDLLAAGDDTARRVRVGEDLYVGGDLETLEYARVAGDVYVQGDLENVGPSVMVMGEIVVGGTIHDRGGPTVTTGGIVNGDPPTPPAPAVPTQSSNRPLIEDKRDALRTDNDNHTQRSTIDRIEQYAACHPCRLTSGEYYFPDGVHLDKETLIIDTTGGPVTIFAGTAPNGGLRVANANLTVVGPNPLHFYTTGDVELMEQDGRGVQTRIATRPQPYRAPNVRLYTVPSARVRFNNDDPIFTGVVLGPGDPDGSEITLTNDATVYGALVGDLSHVNENARIYYDESLGGASNGGRVGYNASRGGGVRVRFAHVDVRTVEVSD